MEPRFSVGEVDANYNIFKWMRIEGRRRYTVFRYFSPEMSSEWKPWWQNAARAVRGRRGTGHRPPVTSLITYYTLYNNILIEIHSEISKMYKKKKYSRGLLKVYIPRRGWKLLGDAWDAGPAVFALNRDEDDTTTELKH